MEVCFKVIYSLAPSFCLAPSHPASHQILVSFKLSERLALPDWPVSFPPPECLTPAPPQPDLLWLCHPLLALPLTHADAGSCLCWRKGPASMAWGSLPTVSITSLRCRQGMVLSTCAGPVLGAGSEATKINVALPPRIDHPGGGWMLNTWSEKYTYTSCLERGGKWWGQSPLVWIGGFEGRSLRGDGF